MENKWKKNGPDYQVECTDNRDIGKRIFKLTGPSVGGSIRKIEDFIEEQNTSGFGLMTPDYDTDLYKPRIEDIKKKYEKTTGVICRIWKTTQAVQATWVEVLKDLYKIQQDNHKLPSDQRIRCYVILLWFSSLRKKREWENSQTDQMNRDRAYGIASMLSTKDIEVQIDYAPHQDVWN